MNDELEQELVLEMPESALDVSDEDANKQETVLTNKEESNEKSSEVLENEEHEEEMKKVTSKRKKKVTKTEEELVKEVNNTTVKKQAATKQPQIKNPLDEMNPTEIAEFFFKMCYYPDSLLTDVKGFRNKEELVNSFYNKFGTMTKSEQQFIETRFQYEVERNATTRKMEITDKTILNALLVKENIANTLIKDTVEYVSNTPIGDYQAVESLTTSTSIANLMSRNFSEPSRVVLQTSDKVVTLLNSTLNLTTAKVYDERSSEEGENRPVTQFAMMATDSLDKSKNVLLFKFGVDSVEIFEEEVIFDAGEMNEPVKNPEMENAETQIENEAKSGCENVKADKVAKQTKIKGDGRARLTVNNIFAENNAIKDLFGNNGYMSFTLRDLGEFLHGRNALENANTQSNTLNSLNLESVTSHIVTKTVLGAKNEFYKIGLKDEYSKLAKTVKKSKNESEKAGAVYGTIAAFEDKLIDDTCDIKDKPIFTMANAMKNKILGAVANAIETSFSQTIKSNIYNVSAVLGDKQNITSKNIISPAVEALNLAISNKQANTCAKNVTNNYLLNEEIPYNTFTKEASFELAGEGKIKLKKD